jgi:hypothetical protein
VVEARVGAASVQQISFQSPVCNLRLTAVGG